MSVRRTVAALGLVLALASAGPALAATPKTSVTDISDEVMCVVCGVPLNIAQSPQADRERAYIQDLIDQGDTKAQIKDKLVQQYGDAVLADPGSNGIAVTTWLVPLLLVLAALGALAYLVPRWRRRRAAEPADAGEPEPPALDEDDAARLDADLARYR